VTLLEAVAAVRENGGRIRRKLWHAGGGSIQVDGANLRDPKLYIFRHDPGRGFAVAARWKPSVKDLLAEDWHVTSPVTLDRIREAAEVAP
jgi:hypothetical protein